VSETSGRRAFARLWPEKHPLIGMVHLLPLPGAPGWKGSMDEVEDRALADARALVDGGMDGVLVENFLDAPFFADTVPPETVAAMARSARSVRASVDVPVGVNVLRNDARAALAVAVASGAHFIRVNVHTGVMWTDQGIVEGRAADTLRARAALGSEVAILADVLVKHATPPPGVTAETAAADTWYRGLADALVATGTGTGAPTELDTVRAIARGAPEAPVLVGSGVTPETVARVLAQAHGAIVGTALTRGGRAGTGIDSDRVRRLVEAARG
jgi:membrane complex biogenesis BtpA family protein